MVVQKSEFTVIGTPHHLRAGDSKDKPVQLLFDDQVLDTVAQLYMSRETAAELIKALQSAIEATA